jgi:hypothetical protein
VTPIHGEHSAQRTNVRGQWLADRLQGRHCMLVAAVCLCIAAWIASCTSAPRRSSAPTIRSNPPSHAASSAVSPATCTPSDATPRGVALLSCTTYMLTAREAEGGSPLRGVQGVSNGEGRSNSQDHRGVELLSCTTYMLTAREAEGGGSPLRGASRCEQWGRAFELPGPQAGRFPSERRPPHPIGHPTPRVTRAPFCG